jgi:very-short-patch-repair endonuclease
VSADVNSLTPNPSPGSRARGIPLPRPATVVRQAARDNRRMATPSESLLWKAIRGRGLAGSKFRRQHPVGPFILDFYCINARLAIEIDGPIHMKQTVADRARQNALESLGIRFLRLKSNLVEGNLSEALRLIESALADRPSPAHGRGVGGEGP